MPRKGTTCSNTHNDTTCWTTTNRNLTLPLVINMPADGTNNGAPAVTSDASIMITKAFIWQNSTADMTVLPDFHKTTIGRSSLRHPWATASAKRDTSITCATT